MRKPKRLKLNRFTPFFGAAIAVLAIGGVAYVGTSREKASNAYTGHHAKCISVVVQKSGDTSSVYTDEEFAANVTMQNDGSSTWSPNYGFYLSEYNSDSQTNIWHASGNDLNRDIPPGGSKTFSLGLTAPHNPGVTQFNWGIAIVYNGMVWNPCTGYTLNVVARPVPRPGGFSLSSSSQTANSITLNWTDSTNVSRYQVYRNTKNINDNVHATNYSDSGLSCNTNYDYVVNAVNDSGSTSSGTKTFKTSACPTTGGGAGGTTGGGSGGGGSGGSGGGSAGGTSKTKKPPLQGSTNTPATTAPDTKAPAKPENFIIKQDETTAAVQLSWNEVTDESGIKAYQLDRSSDNENWLTLTDDSTTTYFNDTTGTFSTHYFYRVRATDNAGNSSEFATNDTTTQSFTANAFPDRDNTISDEANNLSVQLPSGALAEPALCSVSIDATSLPPNLKNYKTVDGPYELICKNLSGTAMSIDKPYSISWTTSVQARKGIKSVEYFGFKDDAWSPLGVTSQDKKNRTDQVAVEGATVFVAMGKVKHSSIILKILLILLILAGVGALVMFILMMRVRRQQQGRYDDYIHKEYGL